MASRRALKVDGALKGVKMGVEGGSIHSKTLVILDGGHSFKFMPMFGTFIPIFIPLTISTFLSGIIFLLGEKCSLVYAFSANLPITESFFFSPY